MTVTESMISSNHLSAIERLGTRVEGTFDAQTAMEAGHLGGWNVRKLEAPTVFDSETGTMVSMSDTFPVVRTNPFNGQADYMGRVGKDYHIVQNEQHAGLLNALVEESGANFELAGSVDGGRKVFMSMKLPGHISVGGVDQVDNSILAINSHDGSMSFTLAVMPVRYACKNLLNTPFKGMSNIIRVRHTSGAQKNLVAQARQALDISFNYLDAFQEQAEQLINTTMTQAKFEELIMREFGPAEGAAAATVTRAEKKVEQMSELFADACTQEGIRDTAWAGYNALTEWADHFAPTRGEDRDNARAEKALLYPSFKAQALDLMLNA